MWLILFEKQEISENILSSASVSEELKGQCRANVQP